MGEGNFFRRLLNRENQNKEMEASMKGKGNETADIIEAQKAADKLPENEEIIKKQGGRLENIQVGKAGVKEGDTEFPRATKEEVAEAESGYTKSKE